VTHHPGLGAEHSGSNAFYSDENLLKRAKPAGYADFAPLPGEAINDAINASPSLRAVAHQGVRVSPLQLADIEVDDGGRSADRAAWHETPTANPEPAAAAGADDSGLDRLADLLVERIMKRLGG
jgi:hypothetical protein